MPPRPTNGRSRQRHDHRASRLGCPSVLCITPLVLATLQRYIYPLCRTAWHSDTAATNNAHFPAWVISKLRVFGETDGDARSV